MASRSSKYRASSILRVNARDSAPSNVYAWQENLAYVPQEVFLFDDTIKRNVVIGQDLGDIDEERLIEVMKLADMEKSDLEAVEQRLLGEFEALKSEGLSLDIATPDEAREMLALKGGDLVGF